MPKFRKKPIVVEARQYTFANRESIIKWCKGSVIHKGIDEDGAPYPLRNLQISTLEGVMLCMVGDWIIKEPSPTGDRRFYPCKPDIFEATYERVEGA